MHDPQGTIKAERLAALREELGYLVEEEPRYRSWRQGVIGGRMLELKALGVIDQEEFDAFNEEITDALAAWMPVEGQ